jgi:hypothetical protein
MSNNPHPKADPNKAIVYQIKIEGLLSPDWTDWFEGLVITFEDESNTLLTGPVVDQAALYGLLRTVRDLGMPLVSVNRIEPDPSSTLPLQGFHGANQTDTLEE